MPIRTVFISGPRQCGKTGFIREIARDVFVKPPHLLRLIPRKTDLPYLNLQEDPEQMGLASIHRVPYDADRVFEILPQAIKDIRAQQKFVTFLIEADADPSLRHAYPYEFRVFIMPAPRHMDEVFRTTEQAAQALKEVMDDTAAFASEIYGLFDSSSLEDTAGVVHNQLNHAGRREERLEVSALQMRGFLSTPLGAEIASRIQLQPEYQALPESDVVLINTAGGCNRKVLADCVRRFQTLLTRVRSDARKHNILCWCDPTDPADASRQELLDRLGQLWAEITE
jgi:hypothetical protein